MLLTKCTHYETISFYKLGEVNMYKIVRFCLDEDHPDHNRVIKTGLTEAEAQEHCRKDDTHEPGVWFDSYTEQ